MTLESPISWQTIEDAIFDWMDAATGIAVDWSNEDRPERSYPWITLKRATGPTRLSHVDELLEVTNLGGPLQQEIEQTFAGDREFVISCQCRTSSDAPDANAQHYLESAAAALQKTNVRQALRSAGAVMVESEPVLDLDEIVGQEWKSGASLDVRFRTLGKVTDKTGYIDKIGISGEIKDVDGSTAYSYSEDIP